MTLTRRLMCLLRISEIYYLYLYWSIDHFQNDQETL